MPTYNGTDSNDALWGTDGDDIFNWSKGQDTFFGGAGYDRAFIDYSGIAGNQIFGQYIGYDSLFGGLFGSIRAYDGLTAVQTRGIEELDIRTGAQTDVFTVDLTQVPPGWKLTIDAGAGSDWISLTLYDGGPGLVGTVVGGTFISGNLTFKNFELFDLDLGVGNDQLTLGNGNDTVEADSGDDYIDGAGGDDVLEGGWGADTLIGGDGNDTLHSLDDYGFDNGLEHDVLIGGNGNDHISVGYGDDADGGAGTDKLSIELRYGTGGVTLDLATLFSGGTIVVGGGTITGFESCDTIYTTDFDDTVIVGNTNNIAQPLASGIQTFGGNDTITSGTGGDVVNAGSGNDVIHSGGGDDRISGDGDNDQVYGEAGNDTLWGGDGNDHVSGGDGIDNILGGFGVDQIYGDAGDDILNGEAGDDFIYGGAGKDTLTGDFGADHLEGGADDDLYVVDELDTVVELSGGGIDEIRTVASHTLGAAIENLRLTGTSSADGKGNNLNNMIVGNAGANVISGLGGLDSLVGGAGNDSFLDTAAGLNGDAILDFSAGDKIIISDASLAGFSYSLSGDVLTYTGGSLTLSGFTGRLLATASSGGGVELTVAPYDARNDFNGDGRSDILWRSSSGQFAEWLGQANGGFANNPNASGQVGVDWQVAGTGDFNGDGRDDILWQSNGGSFVQWLGQASGGFANNPYASGQLPTDWHVTGTGDFNGDGRDDIMWRSDSGWFAEWLGQANGGFANNPYASGQLGTDWQVTGTGDFNGDGRDDILWRSDSGWFVQWLGQANGGFANNPYATGQLGTEWQVQPADIV